MSLAPDKGEEVLIATRLPALVPLAISAVVIAGGLFVTAEQQARREPTSLIAGWCAVWGLLGFGLLIYGLIRLLKPPVIARFTKDGVHFPFAALGPIPWTDFVTARLGLVTVKKTRTAAGNGGTTIYWRTPIILTVRDPKLLRSKRWLGEFTHQGHGMGDGTAEILLKTIGFPISNEALITKLCATVGATPDLRPADPLTATLGGVLMNQRKPRRGEFSPRFATAFSVIFIVIGLALAALGANRLIDEHRAPADAAVEAASATSPRTPKTKTATPWSIVATGMIFTTGGALFLLACRNFFPPAKTQR